MTDFKFQKNWSRHPYARSHKDSWKNGLFADADGSRSKVFLEKGINQKDKKGSSFTNKGVPAPAFLGNRRKKSMRFESLFLSKRAQFLSYGLKLSSSAFRSLKKFEDRFLEYLLFFGGSKKYNWRFALDSYSWLFRRFSRKFKRIWVNKIPVAYGLFRLKRGWRLISLLEFKFGRSLGVWFWRFGRFGVGLKKRSAALSNLGVVGKKYLSFFNLWSKLKRRNRKSLKSFKLEESDMFKRYGDFNLISLSPFFLWYYCLNRYSLSRLSRSLLFSLRKYKDHFISYNTVEYSKVKLPELVMESNDFYRFFFMFANYMKYPYKFRFPFGSRSYRLLIRLSRQHFVGVSVPSANSFMRLVLGFGKWRRSSRLPFFVQFAGKHEVRLFFIWFILLYSSVCYFLVKMAWDVWRRAFFFLSYYRSSVFSGYFFNNVFLDFYVLLFFLKKSGLSARDFFSYMSNMRVNEVNFLFFIHKTLYNSLFISQSCSYTMSLSVRKVLFCNFTRMKNVDPSSLFAREMYKCDLP